MHLKTCLELIVITRGELRSYYIQDQMINLKLTIPTGSSLSRCFHDKNTLLTPPNASAAPPRQPWAHTVSSGVETDRRGHTADVSCVPLCRGASVVVRAVRDPTLNMSFGILLINVIKTRRGRGIYSQPPTIGITDTTTTVSLRRTYLGKYVYM